jgi:2-dehydro-3-deoxygluconokinase
VATPDERREVPGRVVSAVDATGAGDCFGGAFIARIVAGDDPFAAARYANMAAALSTQGFGAVAPIPDRNAVEKALAA